MGRTEKVNFDFFRLETSFFSNKKIKSLRRLHGAIGVSTYLYLLCYIYGNDGYYMQFSSIEQLSYDIAEAVANGNVAHVAGRITDSINYLAKNGMLDEDYIAKGVITSVSIQETYIAMCRAAKRVIKMEKFCLLGEDFINAEKKPIYSEEKAISSEEMPIYSEEMQPIRIEKSKEEYGEGYGRAPTIDEVNAYADEINVRIDAKRFIDYYTAKGWEIDGQPIKDWRAVASKWSSARTSSPRAKPTGNPFLNLLKSEGGV